MSYNDFGGALVRSKRCCAFSFSKSLPEIILIPLEPVDMKLLHTRSTNVGNLKPFSEILKLQTWVFVCNRFKTEESVDSKLHMVV